MNETWQNADLAVPNLPEVEVGEYFHHPLRYKNYRNTLVTILFSFPVLAYVILTLIFPDTWSIWVGSALSAIIVFSFIAAFIGYKRRSYALREKDVTYKKGWLFYATTTIPFNRIQHSEVAQGPLERRYRLSTLKIYTAGGSTSDLSIPGLEEEEAQKLRDYIGKKVAQYV